MFVAYNHPLAGKIVQPALSRGRIGFEFTSRPTPRHGEHRIEILREAGLVSAEVVAQAGDGVT